jgi:hypothetical protein
MEMADGDEQAKRMSDIIIAARGLMGGKRKSGVSDASAISHTCEQLMYNPAS